MAQDVTLYHIILCYTILYNLLHFDIAIYCIILYYIVYNLKTSIVDYGVLYNTGLYSKIVCYIIKDYNIQDVPYRIRLHHIILKYNLLYHTIVYYIMLYYRIVYNVMLYCIIVYNTTQNSRIAKLHYRIVGHVMMHAIKLGCIILYTMPYHSI